LLLSSSISSIFLEELVSFLFFFFESGMESDFHQLSFDAEKKRVQPLPQPSVSEKNEDDKKNNDAEEKPENPVGEAFS
jgi:hypothetical protein